MKPNRRRYWNRDSAIFEIYSRERVLRRYSLRPNAPRPKDSLLISGTSGIVIIARVQELRVVSQTSWAVTGGVTRTITINARYVRTDQIRELSGCLTLRQSVKVGVEADDIAPTAPLACEILPHASLGVDGERTESMVGTRWVQRDVFFARKFSCRKPYGKQTAQPAERGCVDRSKVNFVH
jgi:hypothetical protein